MIFERLKQNIRLLEQLTVFSCGQDEIPGLLPDTAEYLFLSVLKQLQRGDLPAAQQQYQQLCDLLGVACGEGDGQLEPLHTLLHLKLWEGNEQDRQQLQQFLVKQLGLHFEAEPQLPCSEADVAEAAAAVEGQAQLAGQPTQLPSHLTDQQYSAAAFKSLLDPAATAAAGDTSLTSVFDQSCLSDGIKDESLPLQERVLLLQEGWVPPAMLPMQLLVELVQGWVATESRNNTPATDWVTQNWSAFTAEQAPHGAVRSEGPAVLPPRVAAAAASLQLHGRPAPLQLLQEATLTLTATTQDGADVTQVFKDLVVDPTTCQLQLHYSLPQGTSRIAAALTARLLLTLPGTNGEPAWQDFELNSILPGQQGQQPSIEINSMTTTDAIWDVFLTTTTTSSATASAATASAHSGSSSSSSGVDGGAAPAEYVLQVLGRSGEAPAVPKTLLLWLNHIAFNPEHQLRFRVQTGAGGIVQLRRLSGIRQIGAQIEAGVSHVQGQGLAEAGVQQGSAAAGFGGGNGEGTGPMRNWQVARASWWQGGLQHDVRKCCKLSRKVYGSDD